MLPIRGQLPRTASSTGDLTRTGPPTEPGSPGTRPGTPVEPGDAYVSGDAVAQKLNPVISQVKFSSPPLVSPMQAARLISDEQSRLKIELAKAKESASPDAQIEYGEVMRGENGSMAIAVSDPTLNRVAVKLKHIKTLDNFAAAAQNLSDAIRDIPDAKDLGGTAVGKADEFENHLTTIVSLRKVAEESLNKLKANPGSPAYAQYRLAELKLHAYEAGNNAARYLWSRNGESIDGNRLERLVAFDRQLARLHALEDRRALLSLDEQSEFDALHVATTEYVTTIGEDDLGFTLHGQVPLSWEHEKSKAKGEMAALANGPEKMDVQIRDTLRAELEGVIEESEKAERRITRNIRIQIEQSQALELTPVGKEIEQKIAAVQRELASKQVEQAWDNRELKQLQELQTQYIELREAKGWRGIDWFGGRWLWRMKKLTPNQRRQFSEWKEDPKNASKKDRDWFSERMEQLTRQRAIEHEKNKAAIRADETRLKDLQAEFNRQRSIAYLRDFANASVPRLSETVGLNAQIDTLQRYFDRCAEWVESGKGLSNPTPLEDVTLFGDEPVELTPDVVKDYVEAINAKKIATDQARNIVDSEYEIANLKPGSAGFEDKSILTLIKRLFVPDENLYPGFANRLNNAREKLENLLKKHREIVDLRKTGVEGYMSRFSTPVNLNIEFNRLGLHKTELKEKLIQEVSTLTTEDEISEALDRTGKLFSDQFFKTIRDENKRIEDDPKKVLKFEQEMAKRALQSGVKLENENAKEQLSKLAEFEKNPSLSLPKDFPSDRRADYQKVLDQIIKPYLEGTKNPNDLSGLTEEQLGIAARILVTLGADPVKVTHALLGKTGVEIPGNVKKLLLLIHQNMGLEDLKKRLIGYQLFAHVKGALSQNQEVLIRQAMISYLERKPELPVEKLLNLVRQILGLNSENCEKLIIGLDADFDPIKILNNDAFWDNIKTSLVFGFTKTERDNIKTAWKTYSEKNSKLDLAQIKEWMTRFLQLNDETYKGVLVDLQLAPKP